MNAFKTILTDRLLIRKLEIADNNDFFNYRSLPEIYEFQSFKPKDIIESASFFCGIPELPNIQNTWFQLAVCIKESKRLIGDIGIHFLEDDAQTEIGYTIAPDFQGQGYAAEALKAVIGYLFNDLNKHRIIASVDPDNIKSIKLLVKLGMRKEAHFVKSFKINGAWFDDCIYAVLNEEWNK
ncbi:MAG: GNAT family N-acetyltransferase [Eubacteriales bacterium]